VKQTLEWLNKAMDTDEDSVVTDLRKDTVSKMLVDMTDPDVKRVLEIRQELSKTSTKKYDAIETCVCDDNRVRGLLQFYGANRTGRWAGRLVQVQNLPRTYTQNIELARNLVKGMNTGALRVIYGSVPDTLSQLIRTAFVASPGNVLVDADFSAIEARVISWLAGEEWRLQAFREGKDIYCESASQMFGVPVVKHGVNGELRAKGKIAELALGYQGGKGALINMGALDMGLTEDELPDIVTRWRDANSKIRDLWYSMDNAALKVIKYGGKEIVRGLTLTREYDTAQGVTKFVIQLPSGRCLYYINPQTGENQFGGESIIYNGVDQTTKRWKQIETYGGKLVENCVQAIARDCLAGAVDRLEAAGLPVVFHVHDEVVIDVKPFAENREMLKKVTDIMAAPIPWAPTLPLNAEGWVGDFFTKD
jgi:DNA polymerase